MRPILVVLAAGAGSRYGGLKQLAPIGPAGETLLEYAIFDARRAGFERVALVVRRDTEPAFRERLEDKAANHIPIAYLHQEIDDLPDGRKWPAERHKPWGTGQAVLAAAPVIDAPFAVVNADDFYGAESYVALAAFLRTSPRSDDLAVVGFRVDETLTDAGPVSRALLEVDNANHLSEIVELLEVWRRDLDIVGRRNGSELTFAGHELVSMNMWGFKPALLVALEQRFDEFLGRSDLGNDIEFLLPEVIRALVRERQFRVEVLPGSGEWCGLTFQEDHPRVRSIIASLVEQGRYPEDLWR